MEKIHGRRIRRSRKTHRTGSIIKSRASSDPEGVGEAEVVCKAQRLRKAANDVKNFMVLLGTQFDGLCDAASCLNPPPSKLKIKPESAPVATLST